MRLLRGLTLVSALAAVALVLSGTAAAQNENACWGQASAVFAQTGVMGEHASREPTPRLGLRNLARSLAAEGVIEDDSMRALGAFVVSVLGLEVAACA